MTPKLPLKAIPLEPGDSYFDELGRMVFTSQYHLKRGFCCESGCRHCPYDFQGSGRTKNIRTEPEDDKNPLGKKAK